MNAEFGIKGGECALTKLAHYFHSQGITRANIACAAELTPTGWDTGRSLDSNVAAYGAGEIVSR